MIETGKAPSMDLWLQEAKKAPTSEKIGMYLVHNGIVRRTAKSRVRTGNTTAADVTGMSFSYDAAKVDAAIAEAYALDGIYYIRVWLASGELAVGDSIMYVLIGGDIRPHVVNALDFLVSRIKNECVTETEKY